MERKISFGIYIVAFIIAAILFSAGVYVGKMLDTTIVSSISEDVNRLSQRLMTMQVISLMEENNSAFCPVYRSELADIEAEREKLGYELTYLEEKKGVYDAETKKEYFLLEAQSYLLSQKLKATCGDESALVLYFYSNSNCPACSQQGAENLAARDEAAAQNITIRLYSFDGELGSPIVDAFKAQYYISSYPAIVISNTTFRGFTEKTALAEAMRNAG